MGTNLVTTEINIERVDSLSMLVNQVKLGALPSQLALAAHVETVGRFLGTVCVELWIDLFGV